MSWKTLVADQNARTYVLPEGWDSKEKVADDLECSEDRVRILLAPAIKNRTVEMGTFPVWDSTLERVVRITAYRRVSNSKRPAKSAGRT